MTKIVAPFTVEQVLALHRWQQSNFVHPFTCGNRHLPGHKEHAALVGDGDHGILIPTTLGWVCPVCDYRQDWAHAEMLEEPPDPLHKLRMGQFEPGRRVLYIPLHAHDDPRHPDCEPGAVSSKNDIYIFVKFDKTVQKLGWEGTTAQACLPYQLAIEAGSV